MSDVITVTGLELWGYHGVFDHEKSTGQKFIIDISVEVDTSVASSSDDVTQTLNYAELLDEVEQVVTGEAVDLIETLAENIIARVWSFPTARSVTVSVHKPDAPVSQKVADIAVTMTRHRPELTP